MIATLSFADGDAVPEPTQRADAPYRLFRSQNIFTFLKLDTRTGQIWRVQWNAQPEKRFSDVINDTRLADDRKVGRFTLYPTANIFNFILVDQEDGRMWQVQWGANKFIGRIDADSSVPTAK